MLAKRRLMVLALLASAFPAWSLSLCDYVQPTTALFSLSLQGAFRYVDDEFLAGDGDSALWSVSGELSYIYDSPGFGYDVGLATAMAGIEGNISHVCSAFADYKLYAPESDFFAFGKAESLCSEASPGNLAVVLGAGYGRLRDVTPMAKALRIQEKLLEEGSLAQGLSDETLLELAQEIGRRQEYASLEELVAALVGKIEAASGATLSPVAVLRIREVLTALGDQRLCGLSLQAGLGYQLLGPAGEREVVLSGSAEYARPLGLDSQLRLRLEGTSSPGFTSYLLSGSASLLYRLSPTATLLGRYTYAQEKRDEGVSIRQALDASLQFSVAGGWTVSVNFGMRHGTGFEEPRIELTISAGFAGL